MSGNCAHTARTTMLLRHVQQNAKQPHDVYFCLLLLRGRGRRPHFTPGTAARRGSFYDVLSSKVGSPASGDKAWRDWFRHDLQG